jgi:hypothetical protein
MLLRVSICLFLLACWFTRNCRFHHMENFMLKSSCSPRISHFSGVGRCMLRITHQSTPVDVERDDVEAEHVQRSCLDQTPAHSSPRRQRSWRSTHARPPISTERERYIHKFSFIVILQVPLHHTWLLGIHL